MNETIEAPIAPQPSAPIEPTPAPEAPKVEEPKKEDAKFASKFALLSKREKEIFKKEQAIKESQSKVEAYNRAVEQGKADPLSYLQAAGLTLEDAIKHALNAPLPPSESELASKRIEQLEQKLSKREQQELEQQESAKLKSQQEMASNIKNQIKEFVEADSEKYELINSYSRSEDVFDVMFRAYDESSGKITLTFDQAAQLVEDQLLEEAEKEAQRLIQLKKIQKKISSSGLKEKSEASNYQERLSPAQVSKFKTLTNEISTVSPAEESNTANLSRDEMIARAAKLIVWK